MNIATAAVLAATLSMPVLAQPAFAQAAAPPPGQAAVASSPAPDAKRAMQRVEGHIADLRKRLVITPAQEPQWRAFTDVMRQNATRMQASYADRQARTAPMTAVDDLRAYASMERARAEDVERLIPAFETLYQSMTPEQRAAADKTFHDFQRGPRAKART